MKRMMATLAEGMANPIAELPLLGRIGVREPCWSSIVSPRDNVFLVQQIVLVSFGKNELIETPGRIRAPSLWVHAARICLMNGQGFM